MELVTTLYTSKDDELVVKNIGAHAVDNSRTLAIGEFGHKQIRINLQKRHAIALRNFFMAWVDEWDEAFGPAPVPAPVPRPPDECIAAPEPDEPVSGPGIHRVREALQPVSETAIEVAADTEVKCNACGSVFTLERIQSNRGFCPVCDVRSFTVQPKATAIAAEVAAEPQVDDRGAVNVGGVEADRGAGAVICPDCGATWKRSLLAVDTGCPVCTQSLKTEVR